VAQAAPIRLRVPGLTRVPLAYSENRTESRVSRARALKKAAVERHAAMTLRHPWLPAPSQNRTPVLWPWPQLGSFAEKYGPM
jgi:hypothetical protein